MAAITARPGGPSRWATTTIYILLCLVGVCRHTYIRALVLRCVTRHTPALVLPIVYVSRVSRYRHAHARTFARPNGRWQPRVNRCCMCSSTGEVLRGLAHVRTRQNYPNASRVAHTANAVCPIFQDKSRSTKIAHWFLLCYARILPEISSKNFPRKFVVGILL